MRPFDFTERERRILRRGLWIGVFLAIVMAIVLLTLVELTGGL